MSECRRQSSKKHRGDREWVRVPVEKFVVRATLSKAYRSKIFTLHREDLTQFESDLVFVSKGELVQLTNNDTSEKDKKTCEI